MSQTTLKQSIEALRTRAGSLNSTPLEERQEALLQWAEGWKSPLEDRAKECASIARAAGLSPEMVAWGLRTTCEAFASAIETLARPLKSIEPTSLTRVGVCGHVWASTLPTSGWIPVLGTLLAGGTALVKAPAAVAESARLLAMSLSNSSPLLQDCVRIEEWPGASPQDVSLVEGCDAIVVSGGAEAIERFGALNASRSAGPIPYLPFGPGASVSVVPSSALPAGPEGLDAIALDVAAYDQLGCLSPQAIWIEADGAEGREFCQGLADALTRLSRRLPRGPVPPDAAAAIMQRRGTAAFKGSVFTSTDALVLWEPDPYREDCPLYRTIPVHSFSGGPAAFAERLGSLRLHAVAVDVSGQSERAAWAAALSHTGVSRVCAPGTMQTPPGSWHHDGMSWLSQLIRFTDLH